MLYFTLPELTDFVKTLQPLLLPIIGGAIAITGQQLTEWVKRRHERTALTLALISEVESILALVKAQKYVENIENLSNFASSGKPAPLGLVAEKSYTQIYDANLEKVGFLGRGCVAGVVRFYAIVTSTLEDIEHLKKLQSQPLTVQQWKAMGIQYKNLGTKVGVVLKQGETTTKRMRESVKPFSFKVSFKNIYSNSLDWLKSFGTTNNLTEKSDV